MISPYTAEDRVFINALKPMGLSGWLATLCGTGFIKPGPGTWGSLATLPVAVLCAVLGGWQAVLVAALLFTILGLWAVRQVERKTGVHDHGMIVIDEAAGLCLALITAGLSPVLILCAFLLFRLLDITKPWPISVLEKRPGGAISVMADDLAAGAIAALLIGGMRYAGFG